MKKKVLFVNGHLNAGGVEKALIDVLRHIDYERFDVELLLLEGLGDYAPLLPKQVHVTERPLQNTYGSVAGALSRCIRERDWFSLKMRVIFLVMKLFGQKHIRLAGKLLLGNNRYDCAIGFRPGICTQIAAFAADADRRITWWHHGEINVPVDAYQECALACDKIAVVSDGCRRMLAQEMPGLSDKLVTIHNMLDVDAVSQRAQTDPYSDKSVKHIVSVGRLAPEKHFDNAIRAARALKDREIPFCWHLVGDGPLRGELETLVREMDVEDCFRFEGNQPNPYPFFRHADLFVHPSYVESFGIVVTEAMALGVPCVVTRSIGPEEFVEDGRNGLLTDQSAGSLTEAVLRILEDRVLYDAIRAETRCPEKYLPAAVMAQINALLEPGKPSPV